MRKFKDYENIKPYEKRKKLPVGGYVLRVADVRYEEGTNGSSDRIVLMFDIAEGEQKDFFRNQYNSQNTEDKKWKGKTQIYYPKDDGSEKDGWTKTNFVTIINQFAESNDNFVWDWDENTLKGKLIGGIFGEINTVIDGKPITYIGFRFFETVDNIRNGKFEIPKPQMKNGAASGSVKSDTGFMNISASAKEEIPF